MTAFKCSYMYFEVTFYFDVFTKEILTWKVADRRGAREQYMDGLSDVVDLLKGSTDPVVLHTDQGSVYASMGPTTISSRTRTSSAPCPEPESLRTTPSTQR